jgi:hypothetical protein
MELFRASAHYNDWKGTAAADNADRVSIEEYLKEKGLLDESEFLIAVAFWNSENFTSIRAYVLANAGNFESVKDALKKNEDPIPVRELRIDLSPTQFIDLFKILHVVLCWHGFELDGRGYSVIEQ